MSEGVRCKGGKNLFIWSNIKLDTNDGEFRVHVDFFT
jgi:hypothetical protein